MKAWNKLIHLTVAAACLAALHLLVVPNIAFAQFATPTVNGTIGSGEYGTHTDGQNQQTNGSQVWYMTWDNTNLYVGITGANIGEGAIIYLDKNPLTPINGGGNSDGTIVGNAYDGTNFAELQFRADLVMYVKSTYREYRTANGSNGWSGATTGFGSYADNGSNTREFSIPWSVVGGRPSSFAWFGYLTSSGGYVYGQVPTENSGGTIGTTARYVRYYIVNSTADGSSTKPFSRNSYVFNSTSDISEFGTISVYDFTMNTSGRTITRASGAGGAWTIAGSLRVDAGTVSFGSTTNTATVSGNVVIGSGGTLSLSSASGGDLVVGGNWTRTGTFNPNNRQVKFNGSGTQTVTGATTFDYLDIANTSGGNVTLASNITVKRELKISSGGTLNAGATTITVEGSSSAETPFINNGTFNAGTGTVAFTGTNNKNSRVIGNSATTFNNVTLTSSDPGASDKRFGVDFYDHDSPAVRATIAGTLTLNQYTFVATEENGKSTACGTGTCDGTPIYASTSTLRYNNSGSFDSAAEWWPEDGTPDCGVEKGLPYNVVIANSTTVNINAAFNNNSKTPNYSAGSNKIACGNITIESGSALQSTAGTLTVKGNWTNNNNGSGAEGGFTHNNGTVVFNGGATQSIKGTALTRFYNLTLNNTNGVNLGAASDANKRVDNILKLSGNTRLTLGDNDLIMGGLTSQPAIDPDGGSFSASKMIVADGTGALCKRYNATGSYSFPIGDVSGPSSTAEYSPATLNFTAGTFGTDAQACVRVVDAAHPNGDQTNYPTYITRYWPVTQSGISSFTCTATFVYVEDDEVIGSGQSTAALYHWSYKDGTWTLHTQANAATNTLSSPVTSFSDHTARSGSPLAVSLAAFTADVAPAGVALTWETVSEADNAGFRVWRSETVDGARMLLAFVPAAAPGSTAGGTYRYVDTAVEPGRTYWYWLEDVDLSGATTLHGPISVTYAEPNALRLLNFGSDGSATAPFVVTTLVVIALALLLPLAGAAWTHRRRA